MPVAFLAADQGFVYLDGAGVGRVQADLPARPDPLHQIPGGALGDVEFAVQLHAANPLETGR